MVVIIMSDDFFPKGYEVPKGPSNYMRFEQGENKFRILAKPILGYEGWLTVKDDSGKEVRRPIRKRMDEKIVGDELGDPEKIKHFWAMPVWNYQEESVQILQITQKTILRTIRALENSEDWGNPLGYDIGIHRVGKDMQDTEYQVVPSPPKSLDKKIKDAFKEKTINLEALFDGEDPFEGDFDIPDAVKDIAGAS